MNGDDTLVESFAASLQGPHLRPERAARAASIAQSISERVAAAAMKNLEIDDHPADYVALLSRSAAS
jgi:hypothetical protein